MPHRDDRYVPAWELVNSLGVASRPSSQAPIRDHVIDIAGDRRKKCGAAGSGAAGPGRYQLDGSTLGGPRQSLWPYLALCCAGVQKKAYCREWPTLTEGGEESRLTASLQQSEEDSGPLFRTRVLLLFYATARV